MDKSDILDHMLKKWEEELIGITIPGMGGSNWTFVGCEDLSGSWHWVNKKYKATLAATPFWDNIMTIPVTVYLEPEHRDYTSEIGGFPISPQSYFRMMADFLKVFRIDQVLVGAKVTEEDEDEH